MKNVKFKIQIIPLFKNIFLWALLLPMQLIAQTDSCHIRVSLLTASPGEELYSTFGHSALRITDTVSNTDVVYNYGTFDFDDPHFYTKFVRGKLLFYVSTDSFDGFMQEYNYEKRDVTEQVLNLSCSEKAEIIRLLQKNLSAENRFYKYDFLFDNCTTRLRDLIEKAADDSVHFGTILASKKTFRDLIHVYLDNNDKQWSKLGIDILLGKPTDAVMSNYQVMFLPDYLMNTLDSSSIDGRQLVLTKKKIVDAQVADHGRNYLTDPLFIFSLLFLLVVALSFSKKVLVKRFLIALDGFIYFITGLLGILLLFMWFGTDHGTCRDNFNLLWAWPTNILAAFYIHSKKRSGSRYFTIYTVASILLLLCWFFLPQHLNVALIPIVAIIIFRTILYLSKEKI